ncbi:ribosomal protein S18-alanine N-acetyltransferase [Sphingomonas cavernae]|uniref:Ribosomal-protein-alanine N-acetyltransferase n=1 Tax=Sphingomonas cavernae TaxID=2320861 RepID=A0A418WK20_9SPHN|nr:ribosomal protein S18-alanine N-acetyltransferase [Sphingomonas cavernae]RJF90391.1 ribosomal-protein-alanine N-acetyltransferase [Sphingomonas cavernae]
MSTAADHAVTVFGADATALVPVMEIMRAAFDPVYGEAWNAAQCAAVIGGPGIWLLVAELDGRPAGFALTRAVLDEAELLLIAVHPEARRHGVGATLLDAVLDGCRQRSVNRVFLEVRAHNPAIALYTAFNFSKVGERCNYYRGADGKLYDAHSYSLTLKNSEN